MPNISFICPSCGLIISIDHKSDTQDQILKRNYKCTCETSIIMAHSYPPLPAQDFVQSARELFNKCREIDKQNLNQCFELLKEESVEINKSQIDKYVNNYEKIREKNSDNNPDVFLEITDEFLNELDSNPFTDPISISTAIQICSKNKMRKPFIIIVASLIEQLFNDYFSLLVHSKLPPNGAKIFLSEYEKTGINNCLMISSSFLKLS